MAASNRLKICTPFFQGISQETEASVKALQATGIACEWETSQTTYIARGRNCCIVGGENSKVHPALPDFSHFLMLDSDIAFQPQQIFRLFKRDKDIVSGAYVSRSQPEAWTAGKWGEIPGDTRWIGKDQKGCVEVEWCGAGFLLIKREVLEALEFPWFRHLVRHIDTQGEAHAIECGEDQGFCNMAIEAGFKVWLDCDCQVQHLVDRQQAYGARQQAPGGGIDKLLLGIHKQLNGIGRDVEVLEEVIKAMAAQLAERG